MWFGLLLISVLLHRITGNVIKSGFNSSHHRLGPRSFRLARHCRVIERELSIPSVNKTVEDIRFGAWWQNYWEPSWTCVNEERVMKNYDILKSSGDGGKWICELPKLVSNRPCVVYSFGSNGEFSFEFGLQDRLRHAYGNKNLSQCEIHTFDPFQLGNDTILDENCINYQVQRHPFGLASFTGSTPPLPRWNNVQFKMKNIKDILIDLGHIGKTIDIMKIDIDGTEIGLVETEEFWDSFDTTDTKVNQLLIELHFNAISKESYRFRENNGRKVQHITGPVVDGILRQLTKKGFVIFHKEVNLIGVPPNDACEFSMVRTHPHCDFDSISSTVGDTGGKV